MHIYVHTYINTCINTDILGCTHIFEYTGVLRGSHLTTGDVCVAICCGVLQCVAARCSVLQRVAVHCSAFPCVAVTCERSCIYTQIARIARVELDDRGGTLVRQSHRTYWQGNTHQLQSVVACCKVSQCAEWRS